jgi:hypothetical protein
MDIKGLAVIGTLFGLFGYLLYAIYAYYKVKHKLKKAGGLTPNLNQYSLAEPNKNQDTFVSAFGDYNTQDFFDAFNNNSRIAGEFLPMMEINPELSNRAYSNTLNSTED